MLPSRLRSASHVRINHVTDAGPDQQRAADLKIDGDQADAAIIPSVASKKVKGRARSSAGRTLIFPDLNSGNIATS